MKVFIKIEHSLNGIKNLIFQNMVYKKIWWIQKSEPK